MTTPMFILYFVCATVFSVWVVWSREIKWYWMLRKKNKLIAIRSNGTHTDKDGKVYTVIVPELTSKSEALWMHDDVEFYDGVVGGYRRQCYYAASSQV